MTYSGREFPEYPPYSSSRPTSRKPLSTEASKDFFHCFRWLSPGYSRLFWVKFQQPNISIRQAENFNTVIFQVN